jgi:hypothetical protein
MFYKRENKICHCCFLGFVDVYRVEAKMERADFGGFFAQLACRIYSIIIRRDIQNRQEV